MSGVADDLLEDWRRPPGIFVLAPLDGEAVPLVRAIQETTDPKLAAAYPPHITLAGSSGVGPIRPGTPVEEIKRRLDPIAQRTPPLLLHFGVPHRFMQTTIISLPLDPHGALRALHDAIARCGLPFGLARFTFTPHVTLNLYRTLTPDAVRALLARRVTARAEFRRLVLSATDDPRPPRTVLELPLRGVSSEQ